MWKFSIMLFTFAAMAVQADSNITFMGDGIPHEAHISALNNIQDSTAAAYMGGALALIAHLDSQWILHNLLPDNVDPKNDPKAVISVNVNNGSADGQHVEKITCKLEEFHRLLSQNFEWPNAVQRAYEKAPWTHKFFTDSSMTVADWLRKLTTMEPQVQSFDVKNADARSNDVWGFFHAVEKTHAALIQTKENFMVDRTTTPSLRPNSTYLIVGWGKSDNLDKDPENSNLTYITLFDPNVSRLHIDSEARKKPTTSEIAQATKYLVHLDSPLIGLGGSVAP